MGLAYIIPKLQLWYEEKTYYKPKYHVVSAYPVFFSVLAPEMKVPHTKATRAGEISVYFRRFWS